MLGTNDPSGWYCERCGCRHSSSACPVHDRWIPAPPADGHCGKCGAPYTVEWINGVNGVEKKFKPICVCWNLPPPLP